LAVFWTLGFAAVATSANPAHPASKAITTTAPKPASNHAPTPTEQAKPSAFERLPALQFLNINTRRRLSARLYNPDGEVVESAAMQLDTLLCDSRDKDHWKSAKLDRRTLQLVYRAAYHFGVSEVQVVSAYRESVRRREGLHAQGRAIDFRLPGTSAASLAAYLRTIPRVGVGVYTHPKTQFVHLDVREHSFHWLDASPPRRHWRERNISSKTLAALDSTYSPMSDWPEGLSTPKPKP
jgi:uncharacterized protein YcbK (DUF882 family)